MSSNPYRLNIIVSSHGEQLRADMMRNVGSLTGFGRTMQQGQRQGTQWSQTMRALGTTIRYAFAGSIVYGVATAINSLSRFQTKMGEIASLAGQIDSQGHFHSIGNQLNDMGDFALQTSNKFAVAADQVQDAMSTFYSSFQVPRNRQGINQMREFVTAATKLAVIGEGADPAQLNDLLAGMVNAFGGRTPTGGIRHGVPNRMGSLLAQFQALSVGFRGASITQVGGRFPSTAAAIGLSPEAAYAFLAAASLRGGSSAIVARGTTQLFRSLLTLSHAPPRVRAAWAGLGVPTNPDELQNYQFGGRRGAEAAILRAMAAVGRVRVGNVGALGDEELTTPGDVLQQGQVRGPRMLLSNLFSRAEALQQFLSIAGAGRVQLDRFREALVKDTDALSQRTREALKQEPLARTANTLRNLNLSAVRALTPGLNPTADVLRGGADYLGRHRHVLQGLEGGLAAGVAARLFLRSQMAEGLLGRIPGLRRFARAGRGGSLTAASLEGAGLGAFASAGKGTRGDPMWVVIDPISWFLSGAPRGGLAGGGGTGSGSLLRDAERGAGGAGALAIARRVINHPAFRVGGTVLAWAEVARELGMHQDLLGRRTNRSITHGFTFDPLRPWSGGRAVEHGIGGLFRFGFAHRRLGLFGGSNAVAQGPGDFLGTLIRNANRATADQLLQGATRAGHAPATQHIQLQGEAPIMLRVEGDGPLTRALAQALQLERQSHVKIWGEGGRPPSFRGKQKTTRGSRAGRQ